MGFIGNTLKDGYLEHRLEAVILLGELDPVASEAMLTSVLLNTEQDAGIRAAAAWALGELGQPGSVQALVQVFLELAEPIRIEAARALSKIVQRTGEPVIPQIASSAEDQRAGIAWAVSRSGQVEIEDLVRVMVDDDARRWVAYILGTQNERDYVGRIEVLRQCDPEVYFAVTVLWKILASWVWGLEEY